mgnify:CR=1 FL=1
MKSFDKIKDKDEMMNEKNNSTEEMIENLEDTVSENIDEVAEKVSEELLTLENEEEVTEQEEVSDDPKITKKHVKALHLVEKAKKIVNEANERRHDCKLLLELNVKEYENAKSQLKNGGLDACEALVKKLGYETKSDAPQEHEAVIFESKEALKPIVLKDVSSGKFTGFVFALFGGVATAIGLVYLATEKLGMSLNVTKIPSEDVIQSILAWFSTTIGLQENIYIGAMVFSVAVLLVMTLIYVLRVSLKANRNLHFAVKQFVEAELYTEQEAHCKVEMEKVEAHIKDTIDTMKTYEVLLNEQKGKLERILYIEGEKENSRDYHDKSYAQIRETQEIIDTIKAFMETSMSEEGKLAPQSVLLLQNTKEQVNKVLQRYYA